VAAFLADLSPDKRAKKVEELLSRPAEERAAAIARKHLADAGDTIAGLRNLLWALIKKEFIVNR
jgi:hypothetical protein